MMRHDTEERFYDAMLDSILNYYEFAEIDKISYIEELDRQRIYKYKTRKEWLYDDENLFLEKILYSDFEE